jgi:YhcH/YjgK/YiaL family protein
MKKVSIYKIAFLAIMCFISTAVSAQMSESDAKAWVAKGEWRNGLTLNMYAGLNNAEFAKQYQRNKVYWDKAFAFLRTTQLDTLSVGKHVIDGDNVFVTVTEGPTKDYDKTGWEAHRKYLDVHLMIRGKERIGVMNPTNARVTNPYDETKDVGNFDAATKGDYYVADSNTMLIFFPLDSHRPSIHVDGYDTVKKLVVKIKVAD